MIVRICVLYFQSFLQLLLEFHHGTQGFMMVQCVFHVKGKQLKDQSVQSQLKAIVFRYSLIWGCCPPFPRGLSLPSAS